MFADGIYMMEVDRVLRPGGYWILSGPPINWRNNYKSWERPRDELEEQQRKIEEVARLLCWEKVYEKNEMAIWRKRVNSKSCPERQDTTDVNFCERADADDVWCVYHSLYFLSALKVYLNVFKIFLIVFWHCRYKKMSACITPYLKVNSEDEVASGELKPFPARLNSIPPRIAKGFISGVSIDEYQKDNSLWKKHVKAYKKINKLLDSGRYRNIMDMNAGLGSFAAAIESPKLWVMNVVPTIAKQNTLGVIYERGLIGIYHDW